VTVTIARRARIHALAVALIAVAVLGAAGCWRRGVPIVDTAPKPLAPNGTISGNVRGPESTSAIEGRAVEAIDVATGERQHETTSSTGGFTFKLKPGKYRIEVSLREGESIIKGPGVITLDKSDVDAHADFIVGTARAGRRSSPNGTNGSGLGPPIA
jgi:hypothetical protein